MRKSTIISITAVLTAITIGVYYLTSKINSNKNSNNIFITEYKEQEANLKNKLSETIKASNTNKPKAHAVNISDNNNNLKITKWETTNHVSVFYINAPELPMVDILISFNAGSAHEPQKPGAAYLTSNMIFEGTKQLTNDEISEAFDSVGAVYSASVDKDSSTIYLRSLTEEAKLTKAIDVLNNILASPSFPNKNFNRVKNQAIESLKLQEQYPDYISSTAFYKTLYKNHPYAIPVTGSIKDLEKRSARDLEKFFKEYYVAENAQLAIVGALKLSDAQKLAEAITQNIKSGKKSETIPAPDKLVHKTKKHINFPSTQTHILLGTIGIQRNDPDYFPLTLGNHILGKLPLTSLLFKNVRVEGGLAYSVYSQFVTMKNPGPFLIGMQTRNEKADEALVISKQTLNNFLQFGPTDEELEMAKQNLIGQFPLTISSNKKKLAAISNIGFYDLPLDYLDNYIDNINNISKDDIINAFKKHIKLNQMTIITVGNTKDKTDNKANNKTNQKS